MKPARKSVYNRVVGRLIGWALTRGLCRLAKEWPRRMEDKIDDTICDRMRDVIWWRVWVAVGGHVRDQIKEPR